jgi:hypothetical protein
MAFADSNLAFAASCLLLIALTYRAYSRYGKFWSFYSITMASFMLPCGIFRLALMYVSHWRQRRALSKHVTGERMEKFWKEYWKANRANRGKG